MTRIVIADDHLIVTEGLRAVLAAAGFDVIAAVADGRAALAATAQGNPDVLILDVWMPGMNGIAALAALRQSGDRRPVILLTAGLDDAHLAAALEAGANAIVTKQVAGAHLVKAIEAVLRGETYFEDDILARAECWASNAAGKQALGQLSEREQAFVAAAAEGLRNRDIAARFGLSEGAIKVSLHRIYDKLGVSNRTELTLLARRSRMLTDNSTD